MNSDEDSSGGSETLGQMKRRHKLALLALGKKHKQLIKSTKGKAKKQVKLDCEEEVKAMEKEHAAELSAFAAAAAAAADAAADGAGGDTADAGGDKEADTDDANALSFDGSGPRFVQKEKRLTKAQKRRLKREQEERQRQLDAEEEKKNTVAPRDVENQRIAAQLKPLGLCVHEVVSDGHCLYRAVANQLTETGMNSAAVVALQGKRTPLFMGLRDVTAEYMRDHMDEFAMFLVDDNGDMLDEAGYVKYCDAIVDDDKAEWGGQPEIVAMASVLHRKIIVYSAGAQPLEVNPSGGTAETDKPLRVSFHQHYYGLGEHYNSVIRQS